MKLTPPIMLCLTLGLTISMNANAWDDRRKSVSVSVEAHSSSWSVGYSDRDNRRHHSRPSRPHYNPHRPYHAPAHRPYYNPAYRPHHRPIVVPQPVYRPAPQVVYVEQPVITRPAPVVVESRSSASEYWYYCESSSAYYPHVNQCSSGWMRVLP